ncbi:MAG TPA: hypothetical protein VL022_10410 [Moheibacter sp.]|nr:hypothetical protein [Moheibacter sp.]
MQTVRVVVEKVLHYKTIGALNYLKYMLVVVSVGAMGQSKIEEASFKVFEPTGASLSINQLYTQNFFFGNFGLKQLVHAVPMNLESVKTIEISASTAKQTQQKVMQLHYNPEGLLTEMNIFPAFFGEAMTVKYVYQDGLLVQENIRQGTAEKSNQFYYKGDQMVVLTHKGILDIYTQQGEVLSKRSYIDGELVLNDRFTGNCRTTTYQKRPIHKICFSNLKLTLPLAIEEFTQNENDEGKVVLQIDQTLKIAAIDANDYRIFNNDKEEYQLTLNTDGRVEKFAYYGNKSTNTAAVDFTFKYIIH